MKTNKITSFIFILLLTALTHMDGVNSTPAVNENVITCNGKIAVCVGPLTYKLCDNSSNGNSLATGNIILCPINTRCVNDGVEVCVPIKSQLQLTENPNAINGATTMSLSAAPSPTMEVPVKKIPIVALNSSAITQGGYATPFESITIPSNDGSSTSEPFVAFTESFASPTGSAVDNSEPSTISTVPASILVATGQSTITENFTTETAEENTQDSLSTDHPIATTVSSTEQINSVQTTITPEQATETILSSTNPDSFSDDSTSTDLLENNTTVRIDPTPPATQIGTRDPNSIGSNATVATDNTIEPEQQKNPDFATNSNTPIDPTIDTNINEERNSNVWVNSITTEISIASTDPPDFSTTVDNISTLSSNELNEPSILADQNSAVNSGEEIRPNISGNFNIPPKWVLPLGTNNFTTSTDLILTPSVESNTPTVPNTTVIPGENGGTIINNTSPSPTSSVVAESNISTSLNVTIIASDPSRTNTSTNSMSTVSSKESTQSSTPIQSNASENSNSPASAKTPVESATESGTNNIVSSIVSGGLSTEVSIVSVNPVEFSTAVDSISTVNPNILNRPNAIVGPNMTVDTNSTVGSNEPIRPNTSGNPLVPLGSDYNNTTIDSVSVTSVESNTTVIPDENGGSSVSNTSLGPASSAPVESNISTGLNVTIITSGHSRTNTSINSMSTVSPKESTQSSTPIQSNASENSNSPASAKTPVDSATERSTNNIVSSIVSEGLSTEVSIVSVNPVEFSTAVSSISTVNPNNPNRSNAIVGLNVTVDTDSTVGSNEPIRSDTSEDSSIPTNSLVPLGSDNNNTSLDSVSTASVKSNTSIGPNITLIPGENSVSTVRPKESAEPSTLTESNASENSSLSVNSNTPVESNTAADLLTPLNPIGPIESKFPVTSSSSHSSTSAIFITALKPNTVDLSEPNNPSSPLSPLAPLGPAIHVGTTSPSIVESSPSTLQSPPWRPIWAWPWNHLKPSSNANIEFNPVSSTLAYIGSSTNPNLEFNNNPGSELNSDLSLTSNSNQLPLGSVSGSSDSGSNPSLNVNGNSTPGNSFPIFWPKLSDWINGLSSAQLFGTDEGSFELNKSLKPRIPVFNEDASIEDTSQQNNSNENKKSHKHQPHNHWRDSRSSKSEEDHDDDDDSDDDDDDDDNENRSDDELDFEQRRQIRRIVKKLKRNHNCKRGDIYPDVGNCEKYYHCIEKSDRLKFEHLRCARNENFDYKLLRCVRKKLARCV